MGWLRDTLNGWRGVRVGEGVARATLRIAADLFALASIQRGEIAPEILLSIVARVYRLCFLWTTLTRSGTSRDSEMYFGAVIMQSFDTLGARIPRMTELADTSITRDDLQEFLAQLRHEAESGTWFGSLAERHPNLAGKAGEDWVEPLLDDFVLDIEETTSIPREAISMSWLDERLR